ncbi:MAG: HNH endonuclease [Solirubrobacterales bacterium]|nr:HNH endonuclease [Solirubrobacterales bacterium]MBV9714759.1 HNH endonuclease [Solirubrobacterales bacterium]
MSLLDELIERDGAVCVWCGRAHWRGDLTAEHLLPRSRRGRATAENLAVACRGCNRRRRTRPVSAYVRAQQALGRAPRVDLLEAALARLAASGSPAEGQYGRRELELLRRVSRETGPPARG